MPDAPEQPRVAPRKPDREANTPAMLLWREATEFAAAALLIPKYRTAQLHLAAHAVELALKAHLRAKGYTLEQLRLQIGHSLVTAQERCQALGLVAPVADVQLRLDFMAEAHIKHEWRYAHLDRPPHMAWDEWLVVVEWALYAAIPAVAAVTASHALGVPAYEKRMARDVRKAIARDGD